MAVAHDAASESHTGTTVSTSEASFSWTHTPSGTPKGVLVFTYMMNSADTTDRVSAVTYGGTSMTAVSSGRATDSAGEPGDCKAWFLGSSVPTGAQTVQVTRTNDATAIYATCATVTASTDTDTAGVETYGEDSTIIEYAIDDGSPGTNSLRYAGLYYGHPDPAPAGANSTYLIGVDVGGRTANLARETTAGQGDRSVGFTRNTIDDRAYVLLAVIEVAGQTLTGSLFQKAPTFFTGAITVGAVDLAGSLFQRTPTFFTGTIAGGAINLTGSLFQKAPTFQTGTLSATYGLTGSLYQLAPTFQTGAITVGAVGLTGTLYQLAPTFSTGTISQAAVARSIEPAIASSTFLEPEIK